MNSQTKFDKPVLRDPDEEYHSRNVFKNDSRFGDEPVQKPSAIHRELNIRLTPFRILKFFMIVLVISGIFMLGRFSAGAEDISLLGLTIGVDDTKAEEQPEVKEAAPAEVKPAEVAASEPAPAPAPASAPAAAPAAAATAEASVPAPVTTSYTASTLTLNDYNLEWKETWGRITKLQVTIHNKEAGTIKPDHIIMTVLGYEYEKKIPLPTSLKSIAPGKALMTWVVVPGGFSYSPVTAGDLSKVKITLVLRDEFDNPISTISGAYDLNP